MKTKKTVKIILIMSIIVLLLTSAVLAATLLFATDSETSQNTKGDYFVIDLTTGMVPTEVIPGESFAVEPVIKNKATYEMYVFIVVETPSVGDSSVYEYTVGEQWTLVEGSAEKSVYAYASDNAMTTLSLDEATEKLTSQMTMKDIGNTAFVGLDDINVTITGYGIGTENVSSIPSETWAYCKQIGNIE